MNVDIPTQTNPDLAKERSACSFDVNELAVWFHGGAENLQRKRSVEAGVYEEVDVDVLNFEYYSYEDMCKSSVKLAMKAAQLFRNYQEMLNPGGTDIYPDLLGADIIFQGLVPGMGPIAVHALMFTRTLKSHGTPELYDKFGKRAENMQIIGTFAQTELGHGTSMKNFETRADYDHKTDEFVLNTPTFTAYKWWPGGLGHVANYCILVAQLYIDQERKGLQMFLVQLRDEETHKPLRGVTVGDLGKKISLQGVNNGFLCLQNVRIPREQMLMAHAEVSRNGTFMVKSSAVVAYLPLMYVRYRLVQIAAKYMLGAATITTRYSAVRRQGSINKDEPEVQILDFVTQQMKIFPEIATGVAYYLAHDSLHTIYEATTAAVKLGDFSGLVELHALTCVLKAASSSDASSGVERLRLGCGGHGVLAAANFGNLYNDVSTICTFEGENTVMYLEVGKILLKTWLDVQHGKKIMHTVSYFTDCRKWTQFPAWTGSWQCLVQALQYTTTNKIRIAFENLKKRMGQDQTEAEALNQTGIVLTQTAELYAHTFVADNFLCHITGPAARERSASLNRILSKLLELYLVHTVQRHMADILKFIKLSARDVAALQERLELALKELRPEAVAICDGFDFHDRSLKSVLGSYDGNAYHRIFQSAQRSPMNRKTVHEFFEAHLKPHMTSKI